MITPKAYDSRRFAIRLANATAWSMLAALTLFSSTAGAASTEAPESKQPLQALAEPLPAYELRLPDLNGNVVTMDDLEGKVVLINFWATWCPPCRKEMPALQRLSERLSGEPFVVVGVNIGEDPESINDFLRHLPATPEFPILLDRGGDAARAWNVRVVPTTWVVDREAHKTLGAVGEVDFDSPELINQLRALVDSEPRRESAQRPSAR